jgi:hypothetical protein
MALSLHIVILRHIPLAEPFLHDTTIRIFLCLGLANGIGWTTGICSCATMQKRCLENLYHILHVLLIILGHIYFLGL